VSAVVIYIISEIMDGARNTANADGKKKILPKHINNAITKDIELNHIGHNWIIKSGGVKSNLLPQDLGKKNKD
jgi:histone H2A